MWSARFDGGEELARTLTALPAALSYRVLIEGLKEAAEPMRSAMGRNAPREPGAPDLADNMGISVASRLGSTSGGRWQAREEGQAAVAVGPTKNFFYGLFQEYGTKRHGAHPFARPAFDSEAPKALEIMKRVYWTILASKGIHRGMSTGGVPVSGGVGGSLL
jgi:HK97 gp10 family phage protein